MKCGKRSFGSRSESATSDSVRRGCIRVVVGDVECKKAVEFDVEANYLNHPLLEKLLSVTGEEYGYSYRGALRIYCDVNLFRYIIKLLNAGNPIAHYLDLHDLVAKFSNNAAAHNYL